MAISIKFIEPKTIGLIMYAYSVDTFKISHAYFLRINIENLINNGCCYFTIVVTRKNILMIILRLHVFFAL